MDTVVFVDPKAIDYFTNEVILVKVNAEKDTLSARQFKVMGYPTLVVTDKSGKEIDRVFGYLPTDELIKTVTDYRNGIGTLDDLLGKFASKPERAMAFDIAEKYKGRGEAADGETWYNKVISLGEPKDSLSRESRMAVADLFRRDKQYDKALAAFGAFAADFAGSSQAADAEWYRGDVYRRMKDTANAVKVFEEWVAMHPEADTGDVRYTKELIEKLKNPPPKTAETK
ncbi:MAG: thioredoxin family protein [Candidatus Zixiibacteriota bacterium]